VSHASYVLSGYAISLGALGTYTWWVLRRGRQLSKQVPPARRRFLD
jgi:heme exporter protein CcmD